MNTLRILLLWLFLFGGSPLLFGQLDKIAGSWKGTFNCPHSGQEIEIEFSLATESKVNLSTDLLIGKARGMGREVISGREYQFRFNSSVYQDGSVMARIYVVTDKNNREEDPKLLQEVILTLEKKKGKYMLTGNWLFQRQADKDCDRGTIMLQRTKPRTKA